MSPVRSAAAMRWASAALVIPIRGRSSKTSTAPSVSPSSRTSPRVGCMCAEASASSVVFPAPLGPRITHRWSASTAQSTPRSRWVSPRTTSTPVILTTAPSEATALDTTPSNQARRPTCDPRAGRWHDAAVTHRTGTVAHGRGAARLPLAARLPVGRHRHQLRPLGGRGHAPSTCACSTPTAPSTATGWRRPPTRSGTAGWPASARGSATATACTAPTSRRPGSATTRPSCCSTPTPAPSTAT